MEPNGDDANVAAVLAPAAIAGAAIAGANASAA
jgi:hypothetical protein